MAAVPSGPVNPKQKPTRRERGPGRTGWGHRGVDHEPIDHECGVLAVGDEPQLRIDERVRLEGAGRQPTQRRDLPGDREHDVSLARGGAALGHVDDVAGRADVVRP